MEQLPAKGGDTRLAKAETYSQKISAGIATLKQQPMTFEQAQGLITFWQYRRNVDGAGRAKLLAWICEHLLKLQGVYNVARPLSADQVAEVSELILETFGDLTLADIPVWYKSMIAGHIQANDYPRLIDRIDWGWIRDCLNLYMTAKIAHREREVMRKQAAWKAEKLHPEVVKVVVENLGAIADRINPNKGVIDYKARYSEKRKEVFTVCMGMPPERIQAWHAQETDALVRQLLSDWMAEYLQA